MRYGQLGIGSCTSGTFGTPQKVNLGSNKAIAIAAGVLTPVPSLREETSNAGGTISNGQLGIGSTSGTFGTPQNVNLGSNKAIAIAAGWRHTCALLTGGDLQCWG